MHRKSLTKTLNSFLADDITKREDYNEHSFYGYTGFRCTVA